MVAPLLVGLELHLRGEFLEGVGRELVDLQVIAAAGGGGTIGLQLVEAALELLGQCDELTIFEPEEPSRISIVVGDLEKLVHC